MANDISNKIFREITQKNLEVEEVGLIIPPAIDLDNYINYLQIFGTGYPQFKDFSKKESSESTAEKFPKLIEAIDSLRSFSEQSVKAFYDYIHELVGIVLENNSYSIVSIDCATPWKEHAENLKKIKNPDAIYINNPFNLAAYIGYGQNPMINTNIGEHISFSNFPGVLPKHKDYFNNLHNLTDFALASMAIFIGKENQDSARKLHKETMDKLGLKIESFREESPLWKSYVS